MRISLVSAALVLTLLACGSSDGTADLDASEPAAAAELSADGPTESSGVLSSEVLGSISLSGEFPGMEGKVLRARIVTLAPDGQIAVHRHEARPGVAYVVEGDLIEHRNDDPPVRRRAGEAVFENSGVVHWWENASRGPARVVVVDIVPAGS